MARFDQLEFILDARDRRVDRLEARRLPEPDLPYFSDYADLDGYRFQRDVWTANEDVPRNFNHGRRDRGGDIRRRRGTVRVTHRPEGRPPRHSTAATPYRACRDSWHGSSWDRPADRYPQGPDRGLRSYQQPTSWGSPINRPNHGTVRTDRPRDLTMNAPRFETLRKFINTCLDQRQPEHTTEYSLVNQETDDQRLHRIEEVKQTVIVVTDHNVDGDHSDQTCSELLMASEIIIDDDITGVGYDMEQGAQVQALTVTILPREGPTDQVDKDVVNTRVSPDLGGPGSIPTIMSNFDIANSLCDKDEEEVLATWDLDGSTLITRSTTDESDRDGHDPLHCLSRGKNMLYVEGTSITPMVDHEHHHSRDNICGYGVVSNDDKVVPDAELSRDAITDAGVFLLLKSSQLRRVPVVLESLSELGTIIINVDRDGCRRGSDDNMLGLMMNDWGRPSQEHEFSIGGSALGGNFHFDAALLEAQGRGSNYAYNTNLKHIRRLEVGLGHKLNMSIGWKVVLGMTLVVHESTRMLYPATLTLDLDDLIYQFAVWMTPHQWEDVKQLWFPHTPELVNKCEINWTRRGHRLTKLQYYAGRPNGVGFIGLFCVEVSDFADQLASRQGKEFQKKCLGIYYYIAYAYDIISLCCMLWNGVLIDVQQAQQFPGVGIDNYITLSYFDFDKDKMVYIIILVVVELVNTHVVSGEFYQFVFLQLLPLGIKHKVGSGFLHILQKKTHLEGIGDVVIGGDGSNLDEGLTGDVTVSREFECVVLNIDGTAGREACYMAHVIQAPATKRAELLIELRRNLSRAQQRMTASANRHRRHIEFEVGSFVWLKLQPYRQHSVARPISAKLSKRFYGPFEVEERIGPVAYRLRLPEGSRIHDVFHVSLLRAFVKDDPIVPLPEQFVGNRPVVHPVAILDSKILWHKGAAVEHVLVRWLDGSDSPSWEPLADLMKRFPTLSLEDKEVSKDGGVVTNSTQSRVTEETTIEGKAASPPTQSSSTSESVQELENQSVEDSQVDTARKLRPTKDIKQPERYHDFVPSSGPAARRNA